MSVFEMIVCVCWIGQIKHTQFHLNHIKFLLLSDLIWKNDRALPSKGVKMCCIIIVILWLLNRCS